MSKGGQHNRKPGAPRRTVISVRPMRVRFSPGGAPNIGPDIVKHLEDSQQREEIAQKLATAVSSEGFSECWGCLPSEVGGESEEMERATWWLKWSRVPAAFLLAQAWDNGDDEVAAVLSKWMLLRGSDADRRQLVQFRESPPVEVVDFNKGGAVVIPAPPFADISISRSAHVFAMLVCGPEGGRFEGDKSLPACIAEFLLRAKPAKERTEKNLKTVTRGVREDLKALGLPRQFFRSGKSLLGNGW